MTSKTPDQVLSNYKKQLGEEFGAVFYHAYNEWCALQFTWQQYENLFGRGEERVALLNKAGASFFGQVDRHFFAACVLAVCRLGDPAETGNKRNLTVKAFKKFMNTTERQEKLHSLLQNVDGKSEFARDWRNRHISHSDYDLRLGAATPLKGATRAKMSEAIDSIHKVFGFIGLEFMDAAFQPEVSGPFSNEMSMLNVLHAGVTLREETNERLLNGEDVPLTYPDWLKNGRAY